MSKNDFEFLRSEEYLIDLTDELKKGFSHLKIICFKFLNRRILKTVLPYIKEGLLNGSTFELHIDGIHSVHKLESGILPMVDKELQVIELKNKQEMNEIYSELRSLGAKIYFFNKPDWVNLNIIPFSGRDHRKLTIIKRESGENVVYFGATNFQDASENDFMLKSTKDEIFRLIDEINDQRKFAEYDEDQIRELNGHKFLLDIGNHFKSIIEKSAFELIDNSYENSQITFISQLPPEPILLWKFIQASRRKANITIILPIEEHSQITGFPYIIAYYLALLIARIFNFHIYHYKDFIHAKILLVDDSVLLGSHNLSTIGVMAGTVEFSLESKDPNLLEKVRGFINELIIDSTKKIF
jgi:hypothetical protein